MQLKMYTEQDFKGFERDGEGHIICPTGDYSAIDKFPDHCRFGNNCIFFDGKGFGKDCDIGKRCKFISLETGFCSPPLWIHIPHIALSAVALILALVKLLR